MSADQPPWPLPDGPWHLAQEWHHVLFLHWPVDSRALRPLVPSLLEIDTRDGCAWVTALPFMMRRLRPRGPPALPWLSSFPQLNVRTYVTLDGRPGVFLLRVMVGNPMTVAVARRLFHLPYARASLSFREEAEGFVFTCRQTSRDRNGAGERPLDFAARYCPEAHAFHPAPGSLEHWLSERFRYYAAGPEGRVWKGDLDHPAWALRGARVEIVQNLWPAELGIEAGDPPLSHYSRRQTVRAWLPGPAGGRGHA